MIRAILHADKKWGIGKKNDLMFSLPKDMKFFRETTDGQVVVMGENTLLSFPNGKPLKNRTNIVLSPEKIREQEFEDRTLVVVHTMEKLLEILRVLDETEDIYVIGGASMYRQLLPYCKEVLLTKVDADGGAEVFFSNLDEDPNFCLASEGEPQDDNGYSISFTKYENLHPQAL